jgi:hypothetical protein
MGFGFFPRGGDEFFKDGDAGTDDPVIDEVVQKQVEKDFGPVVFERAVAKPPSSLVASFFIQFAESEVGREFPRMMSSGLVARAVRFKFPIPNTDLPCQKPNDGDWN